MAELVRLWAQDEDDAAVISALMQDACVSPAEVHYDRTGRRIVMMVSRYCWECDPPRRIRAALRIESVLNAQRRNWPDVTQTPLELLAITAVGDSVVLLFAGGPEIRVTVECLDLILDDLGGEHPAAEQPAHPA